MENPLAEVPAAPPYPENPLAEHEAAQAALPYPAIRKIGVNMRLSWSQIEEDIHARRYGAFLRRSHEVVTPVTQQTLEDFGRFKEQWELLEKIGLERRFLRIEEEDDYETRYVAYEVKEPQPHVELVYDETVEEFEARVDASYANYAEHGEWMKGSEPIIKHRGYTVRTLLDPWYGMLADEVKEYQENYKW